jgi:plastocyanin
MKIAMFALLTACGLGGFARAARAEATVEGTVQLPKAAPAPAVRTRYAGKVPENIAPPDPPAAVVYLEGQFPPVSGSNAPATFKVEQKHFQFGPGLLPVQKGTTVEFPNEDEAYHNVFSYSKAKHFDLGRYLKDEKPPALVFDKVGVVKLYCEIHEHMRGTILVLDTPHFVKTDPTTGHYRLEHLPAGKYTLKAWLNETTVLEKPVELTDGGSLKVDFSGP